MQILDPSKPIVVRGLPWLDWLGLAIRYGMFGAGCFALGIAFDQFRQGALAYTGLAVLGYVFTTGYSGFKSWWQNEKLKRLEPYAPEDVATRK